MSSTLRIPNEIWLQIFSHFESHSSQLFVHKLDRSALTSLSLVSRDISRLAQHVLYRSIYHAGEVSSLLLLATTIILTPRLGSAVRAFRVNAFLPRLTGAEQRYLEEMIKYTSIPPQLKSTLQDTLNDNHYSDRGSGIAVVASLLLAHMPGLRSFDGPGQYASLFPALSWILGGGFVEPRGGTETCSRTAPNYLPDLQEVLLPGNSLLPFGNAQNLLLHPNIKTLQMHGVTCTEGANKDLLSRNFKSSLQRLVISDCVIDITFLQYIMFQCNDLSELSLGTGAGLPGQPQESLNIDLYGGILRDLGRNLIGSLRQLKRLRHLCVDRIWLVGHGQDRLPLTQVLPASLETFRCMVPWCDEELVESEWTPDQDAEILGLLDRVEFPNLYELRTPRWTTSGKQPFLKKIDGWHIRADSNAWYELGGRADGDWIYSTPWATRWDLTITRES
ncbi:hypothetical protein FHETE_2673 [Fusarium heterosporum]|uniref:F-box domain-containing protein n=1 Tax=Fusarium heterosporum TaxID=42747 RepID=A0A8H5TSV7_FUSHE|nr:hypothetical protein FHETE_2673 [Fusarium heterosporum]